MILKRTILAGILMSMLSLSLHAEVITSINNNSIIASSDKKALAGYKGCDLRSAKEVPAYVFELLSKPSSKFSTCSVRSVGNWSPVQRINSETNSVVFKDLPEGEYKVVCYSGEAIGCDIEGDTKDFPNKSIVYKKETSTLINLFSFDPETQEDIDISRISSGVLKVFPNPATNEITIQLENENLENEVTLSLVNLLGQFISSKKYSLDQHQKSYIWTIDSSNYSSGTYFINLTDGNGKSLQKKILIMKED